LNLSPAPASYVQTIWQSILESIRREDLRNAKVDADNRLGGAAVFASAVRFDSVISPAQITGNQNDYSPTGLATANVLRLSTDAARSITGLTAVTGGGLLLLFNVGTNNLSLTNDSGSSSAANRFAIGANALIAPGHGVVLWYDATSSRWRIVSRSNATFG
jgi:hypothetical protein